MEFEIEFYKDERDNKFIEKFILDLEKSNSILAVKTKQGINKLRNKIYHKEPLSKYLEPDLWELRIKAGSDILRIIYTFAKGRIKFYCTFL